MRILGLDYGSARIGVALGDTQTRLASPWDVIQVEALDEAVRQIQAMAKREGAAMIVVGVPKPLGDRERETGQTLEVRRFIERLRSVGCTVEEEDETLSSALAVRLAQEAGVKGKRDDFAAAAILQSYLDKV